MFIPEDLVMSQCPRSSWLASVICLVLIGTASLALADDAPNAANQDVRAAVEKGLRVVEKSARNYPTHRKCFACHSQTFPIIAMREAQEIGIEVDAALAESTASFISRSFESRLDLMREGQGVPGKALMLGYANATLMVAQPIVRESREKSGQGGGDVELIDTPLREASIRYLIKTQDADGHWKLAVKRPPMEESEVAATVLAKLVLQIYLPSVEDALQTEAEQTMARASTWLRSAPLKSNEDYVFRLCGMTLDGTPTEERLTVHQALLQRQRDDGGWGQTSEMSSDPFATGQSLFALLANLEPADSEPIKRGVAYLLKTQAADGSWFVKSRAMPVQEYFDNGDPYGKDQFISISATGWATAALARSLKR